MSRFLNKYFIFKGILRKSSNINTVSSKTSLSLSSKEKTKSSSSHENLQSKSKTIDIEPCRNDPCPPMLRTPKKGPEPDCKIESVLGSPIKQMYDAKVIIIGAGLAGLAAAQYLQNAGLHNYIILEALERPGGRIHSSWLGDTVIELGSRIKGSPGINPMRNMAVEHKHILTPLFKHDPSRGLFVRSCGYMINFPLSVHVFYKFEKIWKEAYCLYKEERVLYKKNMIEYISSRIQQEIKRFSQSQCYDAARLIYGLANLALYRCGSDQYLISEDNFANYLDLPEGLFRVPLGYFGILTPYLRDIPQDKINYSSPVVNIRWSTIAEPAGCPRAMVVCEDGKTYYADYVLITIPLGVLKSNADSLFCPRLPARKINAISKISFGYLDKLYMEYNLPMWAWSEKNKKISWDLNDMGERSGWIKGVKRLSPLEGSENVLAVTIAGPETVNMVSKSATDIVTEITDFLREALNYPCLPQPVRIKHSKWAINPYFCGSYAYLDQKKDLSLITDLAAPVPGLGEPVEPILFFGGEATSSTHYGTDHGGKISGIREAIRIIQVASCREGKKCSENHDISFS